MAKLTEIGILTYDIPSMVGGKSNATAYEVPSELRRCASHVQMSLWYFHPSQTAEIVRIMDKHFKPGSGVKAEMEFFIPKDPERTLSRCRAGIQELVFASSKSLDGSINRFLKKIEASEEDVDSGQLDDRIKTLYRDAKAKLEDAAMAATSFALTEDMADAFASTAASIESMFALGKGKAMQAFIKNVSDKHAAKTK
jgi:hypothetical protein